MREVVENKVEITKDEARALIERCLKVLYYRDARSYNRVRAYSFILHIHSPWPILFAYRLFGVILLLLPYCCCEGFKFRIEISAYNIIFCVIFSCDLYR